MSNAYASILAALNSPEYAAFGEQIEKANLEHAQRELNDYIARASAYDLSKDLYGAKFPRTPQYVIFPDSVRNVPYHGVAQAKQDAAKGGALTLNTARVISDSHQEWEDTKAFYAARVAEKIQIFLKGEVSVLLNLTKSGVLEGICEAVEGDKVLVLDTCMKINYRYGENAANGHLTIYRQVPTAIRSAKGFDPIAMQAEANASAASEKADRKAKIEDLKGRIHAAEKRKRRIDDLHGTLAYVAKYHNGVAINGNKDDIEKLSQELGLAGVPDLSTAKAMVLSIRDVVKSLKADLKKVKEAK